MNGKQAKKLRKLARQQTQGMPLIQYETAAIKVMGQLKLTGALLLSQSSTRGQYQWLKQNPHVAEMCSYTIMEETIEAMYGSPISTQSTGRGVSI